MFEHVHWSHRGEHLQRRHGITPEVADNALGDPNPSRDRSGLQQHKRQSLRIIGYSTIADDVITVV